MARTTMKVSTFRNRIARKGAIVAFMCAVVLVAGIIHPTYAYGDALSDAQAELAAAQKELTAANNAFASVKAEKAKIDKVNSQANSAAGITNDVIFSGQTPLYVPANNNTRQPANSSLVAVQGAYVNGSSAGYTQQQILNIINDERRRAVNEGLANRYVPLSWSPYLERTAQIRATEASIYGDHTRPSGESWYGVSDEGLMSGSAENLSWGGSYYTNIQMWIDERDCYRQYLSTGREPGCVYGHYKNLVNPTYTVVGIGQFNSDRATVNPYQTSMAAEFGYNTSGTQATGIGTLNTTIYQGVYVKSSALGSIGAAGATTFSPAKVAGDPIWARSAQVKEAKTLAKSMASAEWTRIQSNYNTKQAAVTAAQTKVNNAKAKIIAAGGTVPEETQDMYRMYSRLTGEHLYTSDSHERDVLKRSGVWIYEGVAWVAPTQSNTPVYRLYSPALGDHHYTSDFNEVKVLTQSGWQNEGIAWYSDDLQRYPIYRQFSPRVSIGSHNYTGDLNEYKINNSHGWQAEGIAWYGIRAR